MNTIYCFWTGDNKMSVAREACLQNLKIVTGCHVLLITKQNLNEYILPDYPLHPAYEYLSETHKSDYLRTYFMNFHGGGYSDVKFATGNWEKSFMELNNDPQYWICGYKEIKGGVAYEPVADKYEELIGNGAYICKPQTPLTIEWYNEMIKLLDTKLEKLKENPSKHPRDYYDGRNSFYPIGWNEMLGQIFHRISYKYRKHLMNTLPMPLFYGYL